MRLLLIVLLAVLAAALARPMEPCPAACRCFLSEGLKRADCHHVPEWADLRSDAQDVRILPPAAGRGARSSALHLTHFEVFPKVLKLSVTNRSLVEVIPSGFHGLRSLQVLDLSHNLLSRFNYKVFLRMPALRRLVLTGNHIVLDQGVPLLTSTSLLSLDLSHCDLVSVPKGSLEGLRNLTALSLRGNPLRLEKGHPLVRLATLAELDLSACELEAIPDGVLDGLAGLRRLYLDGNSLHTLERGVLPRGLHHLDLSGNLIREAPTAVISSLRNLTKLELSDNPITCTCSLIGFQGWLSRGLVVTERPVVCAHPPEYRGKSWTKVNELQLCRDEEKLSSNVSESSSSSSSSSSDESSSDDDPSAGSSTNSEDLDDDSLPPASNELYTHENYIGGHPLGAFSLPLKVKKLGDGVTPRTVSHNDISFYLADQPYDATTARSKDDQSEETTSFTTEASVESKDDREAKEDDDEAVPDDFDTDGEEDEVEEDAETFMKNPDTIAMGKSMPEKNENDSVTEKHTTDVPDDAVATEAVEVERVSDGQGTTVTVTESVTNATLHTDAHELNKDDTTTPTYPDAHESSPEETNADEHAKDHAEVQDELTNEGHTENHVEGNDDLSSKSHTVGDLDAEGLDGPYDESEKLASESHAEDHGKDHEETSGEGHEEHEIDGHEDEAGEGRINEQEGMVTEHVKSDEEGVNVDALIPTTQVNADSTTASTPTETSETETVAPVLTADSGDRSDRGLVLENSEEPSHEEEEHHESVHLDETLNVDVGAGVETHETNVPASSPVPEEPPEGAAAAAGDVETTPESAAAPVEENIVPVVATNIVGSEKEGEPVETEAKPEAEATPTDIAVPDVEGVPEQLEVDTKPELDVKIEEVIPNSTGAVTASPLPSAPEAEATPGVGSDVMNGPSADVETVGVLGIPMEGDKLSEDLAVEKVPQSQGEDGDADAQLQKSTITYVILGCIVVTMVVLVMYALLRSKAKQADSEKGTRIRRENGDSRSHHGQPEGTEMKDMMNPLLGSGAAQTDPEQTDHGRRASLVSLELIREVEEDAGETTRLQPNGPDSAAAIPIKGASVESKPPRKTTGAAKRPNGNWNGKPAVSDGDVAPEAPQATQATPASLATPDSQTTPSSKGATAEPTTPRQQRAADQPSKVKVKAGVITTPVPRTPVLVNRVNGNGMKVNGFNRST